MYFEVSKEVFDKMPEFTVGVVAVQGIDNTKDVPAITEMLDKYAEECRQYFEASGNKAKDTEGCILCGRNTKVGMVTNSRYWTNKVNSLIETAYKRKEEVTITIHY